jgi:bacillithiol biosynthesis cysteine-adding enzyme BshC
MTNSKIALHDTACFSAFFTDYIAENESLKAFYHLYPSLANAEIMASKRAFEQDSRKILVNELTKQYQDIADTEVVTKNIQLLNNPNTFTITTGHQLNVATGPMYVILKLITAINTAQQLNLKFPQFNFVPIYWMATEDHDFEEINHFNLFGKTHTWETNQTGAVGRFVVEALATMFPDLNDIPSLISNAYRQGTTLAKATQQLVHALMGKYGLVCLDADVEPLKALFVPIMQKELLEHNAEALVQDSIAKLKLLGYKNQVNPRNINLFYLDQNCRERIEKQGDDYIVLNTDLTFSTSEIIALLHEHPEKFSPNVVLRPLYQSTILPDIAMVGGPSEIVYWLQLKSLFTHHHVNYPLLMPRNFAMLVSETQQQKLAKVGIVLPDLFLEQSLLKKHILKLIEQTRFDMKLEMDLLAQLQTSLLQKANAIDVSLAGSVMAEMNKMTKGIDELEKRIIKALERKNETTINQVMNIKAKLFPNDVLQERVDNVFNFLRNNPDLINSLVSDLDPFDFSMNLIVS